MNIKPLSEIQVEVESSITELEKKELELKLKQEYGQNINVLIKGKKVKNEAFENNRENILNNNLKDTYKDFLQKNYPEIDQNSFFELDDEISKLTTDQSDGSKRFKVKNFSGKNILSFNEFEVDLENKGILRIYSDPQNMGGKSNLIRCLKILLFGEFYRSNQERSTLATIINKFSPLNFASVEGEIEIENKVYFIRRDFIKNQNGKVSQKVLVSCEGVILDVAYFDKMIGKIKDFLFISFFDSFSIEKWLNTKPTERYRMFLNYFGLGNIEEKSKISKTMYDQFLKTSVAKSYQGVDVEETIKNLKINCDELSQKNKDAKITRDNLVNYATELELKIDRLKNQLKGVPDSLLNETSETINEKILELENSLIKKNADIVALETSLVDISEDKETLVQLINNFHDEISKVQSQSDLKSELETLNYLYSNYVVPSNLLQEKDNIQKSLENLRHDYSVISTNQKNTKSTLEDTPDFIKCPNCNSTSDNSKLKQNLSEKIEKFSSELEVVKISGVDLKNKLADIEFKIKESEINYKKDLTKEINDVTLKIENEKKKQISEIREKISAKQSVLIQIAENEKSSARISLLNTEIKTIQSRLIEFQEKIKHIVSFSSDLLFNDKINADITKLSIELSEKMLDVSQANVDIILNDRFIKENNAKVEELESNKLVIIGELKKDKLFKTYLEIHSKGGLAMKILEDLTDDINQDLSVILSHDDFKPYIKIENDAIEFYFSRQDIEFNMAEGSGYEKTVLLLALHYLLLSKMTVPMSNIFILDEVFVAVAAPYLNRAYKVVENLLNIFDTILLITHVEEIAEWCNDSIKVSKHNNISKLMV
jgi:DNA repair exonuclease SbcCD ATPase subunit